MKIKARRVLTLALALVMAFSVMSFSVMAEGEYVPTTEDTLFTGDGGGIIKTTINNAPYYVAYGHGAIYTSLDGNAWDKRNTTTSDIASVAYGNDMGIAITIKAAKAQILTKDMNSVKATVYNYVPGATADAGYFITLIPNLYYDSYSGLFFCHGYNETANALNIYYTDGTLTTAANGGTEVSALSWTKVTGDFLSSVTHTEDIDGIPHWLMITGDGKGNILAPYGQNRWGTNFAQAEFTGNATNSDIRRWATVIKTTSNKTVTGASCLTNAVMSSVGAITDNGIAVLRCYGTSSGFQRIYVADLNTADFSTGTVTAVSKGDVMTDFAKSQVVENMFVNGNDVYIATGACNTLYKFTVNYDATAATTAKAVTLSAPENILANTSFGDADTTNWLLKDMCFVGNNKALLLYNNNAYASATASYLYELDLTTNAVTQLKPDTYFDVYEPAMNLSVAMVRGYQRDTRIMGDDTTADGKRPAMTYTCVSDPYGIVAEGSGRYLTVKPTTAPGTYTVTIRATVTNQPSIFADFDVTAKVVPYYTASLNNGAVENEASSFTLTGGSDVVSVKFAKEAEFAVSGSKTDATLENACVLAAVYDKDTNEMKSVNTVYANTDITTADGTECTINVSGNAGDTVKLFVWKNLTTIAPFITPLVD